MFHRIGYGFRNQKAEGDSKRAWKRYLRSFDDDSAPGALFQQQVRNIAAQRTQILLELDVLLTIQEMQSSMHAPKRRDAAGRNGQLVRRLRRRSGEALQRQ